MSNVATGLPVVFYTYVTAGVEPAEPEEGETWYDTQADESKVYDGGTWNVQNIESHGALSGIGASDHHARYSDDEASAAAPVQSVNGNTGDVTTPEPPVDSVNGQTGAVTVDTLNVSRDENNFVGGNAWSQPTVPVSMSDVMAWSVIDEDGKRITTSTEVGVYVDFIGEDGNGNFYARVQNELSGDRYITLSVIHQ